MTGRDYRTPGGQEASGDPLWPRPRAAAASSAEASRARRRAVRARVLDPPTDTPYRLFVPPADRRKRWGRMRSVQCRGRHGWRGSASLEVVTFHREPGGQINLRGDGFALRARPVRRRRWERSARRAWGEAPDRAQGASWRLRQGPVGCLLGASQAARGQPDIHRRDVVEGGAGQPRRRRGTGGER